METGQRITEAVVLAAGNGTRLVPATSVPKPLVPVAGRPLLGHVLDRLAENAIQKVFIVVGYRGDEIIEQASPLLSPKGKGRTWNSPLAIEWVRNPDFHLPNGVSLSASEDRVRSPFLLLMSDHLFEPSTLRDFLALRPNGTAGILATDSKIAQIFDLNDATKVRTEDRQLRGIGKELETFDAIDTGMFVLTDAIFPALRRGRAAGDASVSGGIATLAGEAGIRTWDIGPRRWIDVDTPEALAEADRLARLGCFSRSKRADCR